MAGTLDAPDQRDDAHTLAAAGAAIRLRHGLVAPPWLTLATLAQERIAKSQAPDPLLTDHEAVALALTYEPV